MPSLKDKLALMKPALVVAWGDVENVVDFDADKLGAAQAMVFRIGRIFHSFLCQAYKDDVRLPPPPAPLTKLDIIEVAAYATAAALINQKDTLAIDPETVDPAVLSANVQGWKVFEDFYKWIVLTVNDPVYWNEAPEGVVPVTGGGAAGGGDLPAVPPSPRDPSVTLSEIKALLASPLKDQATAVIKTAFGF